MTLWYRSAARSILTRHHGNKRNTTTTNTIRSLASSYITNPDINVADWQKKGWLDERELLQFGTLHEMQDRACQLFPSNKLFATHNAAKNQFEWMSYSECECVCRLRTEGEESYY